MQYCYGNDVLKNLLPYLLEQLELCQKALSGYLDQKRSSFPRFYFVSDAVLLEVHIASAFSLSLATPRYPSPTLALIRVADSTHLYLGPLARLQSRGDPAASPIRL